MVLGDVLNFSFVIEILIRLRVRGLTMIKRRGASNKKKSPFENAAILILKDSKRPLTMNEIATRMVDRDLVRVRGKTPEKSLYGVIYRREKARRERGEKPVFERVHEGHSVRYTLNK